jgi:transcriptional regulator with XRE-family HTH domain
VARPRTRTAEGERPSPGGANVGSSPRQRELGKRIRSGRLALGLSQEKFAAVAQVDRSYVGQLETGLRNPNLDTLCRLARGLGIDVADLVSGLQRIKGR